MDPAVGEYILTAGGDNSKLPAGGVFTNNNLSLYHYGNNNPITYTDPDGRKIRNSGDVLMPKNSDIKLGKGELTLSQASCTLTSYVRMANALGANVSVEYANEYANKNNLFTGADKDELSCANGAKLVNGLLKECGITSVSITYQSSVNCKGNESKGYSEYSKKENDENEYFCNARIYTTNKAGDKSYGHTVSVDSDALESDRCDGKPTNMKIKDTSYSINREKIRGDDTGINNFLQRLDFFMIIKTGEADE